jgi:hypothetical protein
VRVRLTGGEVMPIRSLPQSVVFSKKEIPIQIVSERLYEMIFDVLKHLKSYLI